MTNLQSYLIVDFVGVGKRHISHDNQEICKSTHRCTDKVLIGCDTKVPPQGTHLDWGINEQATHIMILIHNTLVLAKTFCKLFLLSMCTWCVF